MNRSLLLLLSAGALALGACSSGDDTATPDAGTGTGTGTLDLRADTNRNGTIDWNDPTEDKNEDTWDQSHGAIFLANIDDDLKACPSTDGSGAILSDAELAKCNDAADTVVNGDADAQDLAPLGVAPWPGAPAGATATFSVDGAAAPYVHLFIKRGPARTPLDWTSDALTTDELHGGATLAIEATDIVRDPSVWDGYVTLTLTSGTQSDVVKMRVAPVVLRHHLAHEDQVYVTAYHGDPDSMSFRGTLYAGITGTDAGAGEPTPPAGVTEIDGDQSFAGAFPYDDQWTQDFFEVGYMSMPAPGGKQHVIDVFYRSANVYNADKQNALRDAGKVVFTKFRGPDAAGVQAFDFNHDANMDSLNSFGNLETIPPYSSGGKQYPLGRIIRGQTQSFFPDPVFEKMLEAQDVQPPVYIDTSWLLVGHVDETMSFVKASTPRGWALLVNDPTLARQMLQDQSTAGNGAVAMFEGLDWLDNQNVPYSAQTTIDQVLADTNVMSASNAAATAIDGQLQVVKQATGLTDAEIIHVPFLHEPVQGFSLAYQPGTVNGLYPAPDVFESPDPHGPVIGGVDIFKKQLEDALAPLGIKVAWVEDWNLYHRLSGEVHCASNSRRAVGDETWWTSGY